MEEHPNILGTNVMRNAKTIYRLKRKLPQDLCTYADQIVILWGICHWAYTVQDFLGPKCHMYC